MINPAKMARAIALLTVSVITSSTWVYAAERQSDEDERTTDELLAAAIQYPRRVGQKDEPWNCEEELGEEGLPWPYNIQTGPWIKSGCSPSSSGTSGAPASLFEREKSRLEGEIRMLRHRVAEAEEQRDKLQRAIADLSEERNRELYEREQIQKQNAEEIERLKETSIAGDSERRGLFRALEAKNARIERQDIIIDKLQKQIENITRSDAMVQVKIARKNEKINRLEKLVDAYSEDIKNQGRTHDEETMNMIAQRDLIEAELIEARKQVRKLEQTIAKMGAMLNQDGAVQQPDE